MRVSTTVVRVRAREGGGRKSTWVGDQVEMVVTNSASQGQDCCFRGNTRPVLNPWEFHYLTGQNPVLSHFRKHKLYHQRAPGYWLLWDGGEVKRGVAPIQLVQSSYTPRNAEVNAGSNVSDPRSEPWR